MAVNVVLNGHTENAITISIILSRWMIELGITCVLVATISPSHRSVVRPTSSTFAATLIVLREDPKGPDRVERPM